MNLIDKFILAISNPREIGRSFMIHTAKYWKNDALYLRLLFYFRLGYKLDLKNPKTFNQKLQWLKLYNRKPEYASLVDKCDVKSIVANIIGEEFIIPTLAVWDNVDDIEIEKMPEKFVLKTTNGGGGGGVVICKDKNCFDLQKAKEILEHSLKADIYINSREWPYKNVSRRVIAEKFMEDSSTGDLRDYKFYCFNGVPKAFLIVTERFKADHSFFDYFDMNGKKIPFQQGGKNNPATPAVPKDLTKMKELAAKLSSGIPHVRVDFYYVNGAIYFGELTFFDSCGFGAFEPIEWDYKFGEWLSL